VQSHPEDAYNPLYRSFNCPMGEKEERQNETQQLPV